MILVAFLIVGLIVGLLRGGGLSGLAGLRLRAVWLVYLSLCAQLCIVFLPRFYPGLFPGILPVIQLLRYLPLLLFAILNLRKWQVWLIGIGFAMNFAVIAANGWKMPVFWDAQLTDSVQRVLNGSIPEYFMMNGNTGVNLLLLADIIPIPLGETGYASIGDFVLGLGVALTVQHAMARYSIGKHARGSLLMPQNNGGPASAARRTRHAGAKPAGRVAERLPDQAVTTQPTEPEQQGSPIAERATDKRISVSSTPIPEPRNKPMGQPDDISLLPLAGPYPPSAQINVPLSEETNRPNDEHGGHGNMHIPIRLSPRLAVVARIIGKNSAVADVGCDHGKLSAYLALDGSPRVISLDISAKSLAKTKQLVKELALQRIVQTRVSDGLKKLRQGEADVIVIAGLGGQAICSILQSSYAVACSAAKLVLQPMNNVGSVRQWLVDNGFCITEEQLAAEDDRIYQILAAVPGADSRPPMSLFDLEVGHLLIDRRHPLLPKLLHYKLNTINDILAEIADNATPKAEARRSELIELKGRCEEAAEWLAR